MQLRLTEWITNPFVLMSITVYTGILFGRIKVKRFSLGMSGVLFTGLVIGWGIYEKFVLPYEDIGNAPAYAREIIKNGVVGKNFFYLFLILFVTAVGLLAARDLGAVIKKHGFKFVALGFLITFTGAAATYLMAVASTGQDPFMMSGVYTGALTSSPGLGAALEAVSKYGGGAEAAVGAGYAIGYPCGVIVVILAINFIPVIFRIDMQREREMYIKEMAEARASIASKGIPEVPFDMVGFMLTIFLGCTLGTIKVSMGRLGYFSLGSTGGVLIGALVLGYIGKIGSVCFRMDGKILGVIRQVCLAFFLAVVGLRYGYQVVHSLKGGGAYLSFVSLVVSAMSIFAGYLAGRYVFKINWIMLAGAICGGMTSTPGLGAAIDAIGSDEPAAGYGAVYPFALMCKVIFVMLLHRMPMA